MTLEQAELMIGQLTTLNDATISIYALVAFAVIVSACIGILYLMFKPLLIFLQGGHI